MLPFSAHNIKCTFFRSIWIYLEEFVILHARYKPTSITSCQTAGYF